MPVAGSAAGAGAHPAPPGRRAPPRPPREAGPTRFRVAVEETEARRSPWVGSAGYRFGASFALDTRLCRCGGHALHASGGLETVLQGEFREPAAPQVGTITFQAEGQARACCGLRAVDFRSCPTGKGRSALSPAGAGAGGPGQPVGAGGGTSSSHVSSSRAFAPWLSSASAWRAKGTVAKPFCPGHGTDVASPSPAQAQGQIPGLEVPPA